MIEGYILFTKLPNGKSKVIASRCLKKDINRDLTNIACFTIGFFAGEGYLTYLDNRRKT